MRAIFAMIFLPLATAACQPSAALTATPLRVGTQQLTVELATTPEQRARGLMYRKKLAENHGMLFIFRRDQLLSFYMKNTTIPLSIAYIDRNGVIQEIHQMQPLDLRVVSSSWPVRYALEVNQGWFQRHQVVVGDRVALPPTPG